MFLHLYKDCMLSLKWFDATHIHLNHYTNVGTKKFVWCYSVKQPNLNQMTKMKSDIALVICITSFVPAQKWGCNLKLLCVLSSCPVFISHSVSLHLKQTTKTLRYPALLRQTLHSKVKDIDVLQCHSYLVLKENIVMKALAIYCSDAQNAIRSKSVLGIVRRPGF